MMTKRRFRIVLFLLITVVNWQGCYAKPISSVSAERLLELGKISSSIAQSQQLSGEQWAVMEKSLKSGDDVSVAVATLFLQRINNERSRALLVKLGTSDTRRNLLLDAVLKTGQLASELATAKPDERTARWQTLAADPNPYARIAGAKALCAIDPTVAKAVLLRLEKEKSEISPAANRLRRELAAQMGEELPPPIPGFETVYTWFERSAGALASVKFADRGGSSAVPPHESSSTEPAPVLQPPTLKETPKAKAPTSPPGEDSPSSLPKSVLVVLLVTVIGLLRFLLKRRP